MASNIGKLPARQGGGVVAALSEGDAAILLAEITNDPLSLGYSGKTNAQIADLMNAPGSASYDPPVLIVSDLPVMVPANAVMGIVATLDGMTSPNQSAPNGASVVEVLKWFDTSSDNLAVLCRYFWNAAAEFNIADPYGRQIVNDLAGIEVSVGAPPITWNLISETAMNAVLALGMVAMSRAQELINRRVTEADIAEALA